MAGIIFWGDTGSNCLYYKKLDPTYIALLGKNKNTFPTSERTLSYPFASFYLLVHCVTYSVKVKACS